MKKRHLPYIIFFLFTMVVPIVAMAGGFDILLLKEINLNRNKQLDPFFIAITNTVGLISIGFPFIVLAIGYFFKKRKCFRLGVFFATAILTAVLITNALKYSINRPRPFETYTFIEKVSSGGSPSFPSGHTSDAFVLATALSLAFPRWFVFAPSYLWAFAIAYSRMSLGVHYPIDVLIGAIIGILSAWLMYKLTFKYVQKV